MPTPRRVAIVCPYSWSGPGGVQTHVRGLAGALRKEGIEVDVFAPVDGPEAADGVVRLGRSVAIPDNGSVCRVAIAPGAAARSARLLGGGRYDVVHLHEPMIPFASLGALHGSCSSRHVPHVRRQSALVSHRRAPSAGGRSVAWGCGSPSPGPPATVSPAFARATTRSCPTGSIRPALARIEGRGRRFSSSAGRSRGRGCASPCRRSQFFRRRRGGRRGGHPA